MSNKYESKEQRPKYTQYNILKSFYYAFNGVKIVYLREVNPRIQFFTGSFLICVSLFMGSNVFAALHLLLMLLTISQEIMNTALEELCDLIDSNYNLSIKRIKDIAAGSVLVGALAWISVIIFQILIYLFNIKFSFNVS